jgi:selenocysteine lyase/cysteine desulfurase
MIDWPSIRKQFPVTEHSVYLNTAAAGPLAQSSARAGAEYYELMMKDGDLRWHQGGGGEIY